MTLEVKGLDEILIKIANIQKPDVLKQISSDVAFSVLPEMVERVVDRGEDSNDSDIGVYSTDPIYVSGEASVKPKKPLKGKYGAIKFKDGSPHKSKYYPDGYSGYKKDTGRSIGKVNLSLTRQMMNELTVIQIEKGYGLGWDNSELIQRFRGFEKKYKKKILSSLTLKELEKAQEQAEISVEKYGKV